MKYEEKEIKESEEKLKELIEKADYKMYTILNYVNRMGTVRHITTYVIIQNEPIKCDWWVARVTGSPLKVDGVIVEGCGADMGYELVYNISLRLFGDGYKIKQKWL